MANLSGQAFFEHDAELLRQGRVTGDPLAGLSPVNDRSSSPHSGSRARWGKRAGIGQQRAAELSRVWVAMTEGLTRSIQTMDAAITHSFAKMLIGAESFKDGYLDIWKSIQAGIVNILGEILSFFTKQFLGGLIKSLSSANLAQTIGNAIAGGVSGTALGGGPRPRVAGRASRPSRRTRSRWRRWRGGARHGHLEGRPLPWRRRSDRHQPAAGQVLRATAGYVRGHAV